MSFDHIELKSNIFCCLSSINDFQIFFFHQAFRNFSLCCAWYFFELNFITLIWTLCFKFTIDY